MSSEKTTPVISIIITAHHEAQLLHKTVLSIVESAKSLDDQKILYEVILSLDNPDLATKECAMKWSNDFRFIISEISLGNPSDNRNHAVKLARGRYVALLDGDDLVTKSWLANAYKMILRQKNPVILRPSIHAQFGYEENNLTLWIMRDSSTKEIDAIQMAYWNLWTNALFTQKDVLISNPYKIPKNGFGFEDYLFASDTIANGVANLTVPETAIFYRRRPGSVSTDHLGTILDYSDLFDISFMKSIPIDSGPNAAPSTSYHLKRTAKRAYRFAFDTAKKVGPINRAISPLARDLLYNNKIQKIPGWFINEWKNINKIENQLWPTRGEVAKVQFHPLSFDPYHNQFGKIYQQLCNYMSGDKLDYLFLAPTMSGRGGTEKVIANYVKALRKEHPDWKFGILSTQPYHEAVYNYFKELDIDMLDFGGLTKGIGNYEKNIIWSRILIQSKVKRLHLLNDDYWYHWISNHQKLLINNDYKIYISLFMREFAHEKGRIVSFADPHLMHAWPAITKVFSDNRKVIDDALDNNAFDEEKMIVHYQPQDITILTKPKEIDPSKPIRVLWASRVSHQKRPDILKKIAAKLGDGFVVDAYGAIEKKQYPLTYFNDSKVNYKGVFSNGISSLKTADYDIYLYTSQTDGIPNILMEVSAAGLPIVASDIGGVSEFIKHEQTGLLVDMEDIDGYVKAIKSLVANNQKAQEMVIQSQKLVLSQHSWDNYPEQVNKDII